MVQMDKPNNPQVHGDDHKTEVMTCKKTSAVQKVCVVTASSGIRYIRMSFDMKTPYAGAEGRGVATVERNVDNTE